MRIPSAVPFYLVRHGQSEWNVRRLTQGQVEHPPLTTLGREQAVRAVERIAADLSPSGLQVGRFITSDLVRATQTARILTDRVGAPVTTDHRLREQHLGSLQGCGYDESFAAADAMDWSDPTRPVAGGESLMDVYGRMEEMLAELDGSTVVVLVSHGDAIRAAIAVLAGVLPHVAPWVDVPNGAVARVERLGPSASPRDTSVTWLRD